MPLHAVEPRRLYRQIAEQLRGLIGNGEFAIGSRLPAERDLAAQLGVSRPSVREALIALEVEGLVEVRPGSGIHVLAREPAASAPRLAANAFGPFEIMQARQLVEGELAALAAMQASKDQVAGLREALVQMESDVAGGTMPIAGDRVFHLRLAEAAGNAPLVRTVATLYDERNNPLFDLMGRHFENEKTWRRAIAEHKAVVTAVAGHKPEAARAAMHLHLQRSQERYADVWPQPVAALTA
jgi:GntR family transcriptional regulator, transcriptional repressor for pyruvate dehydrogenase complex